MSISVLQEKIRKKKTLLAVHLCPTVERINPKILHQFTEMYGEGPMANAETLRYHGCQVLDGVGESLSAAVLDAGSYLRYGAMGMDVLANLVGAAKARDLYTIVDCRAALAEPWLAALPQTDAVTVLPYLGGDACAAGEDKAVFALVRTANPTGGDVQRLMSGDRKLYLAAVEQMTRRGAALAMESDCAIDVKDLRKRAEKPFLLLLRSNCETVSYAVDLYGHGALLADEHLQYAEDVPAATATAVAVMKKWAAVV